MQKPKKTARGEHLHNLSFPVRFLAGGLLCLLLLPLAVVVALHVPAVQDTILRAVVQKLETSADLQIQLAGAHWSPFRELNLLDLKVKAAGENLIECEKANLGYHLSWKWPYLYPEAIVLEKPSLHLERDAQGRWQFPGRKGAPPEASQPGKPFPWSSFPWPQVRIVAGTITGAQNGQVVLSIRDVNATLSVQEMMDSDGPWLKLDFGQWQGSAEEPAWGRWQFSGQAEIRNKILVIPGMELEIPGVTQLHSQGQWSLVPPYDGALALQVGHFSVQAFPTFQKAFSQLSEISGVLRLNRHAGKWSLEHDLKTTLGSLQGTLQVDLGAADGRIVQLSSRFADLQVPVLAQTSNSHLFGQVDLTLKGLDLDSAQASLHAALDTSWWGDQTIHRGELSASYEHGMLEIKPSKVQSSLGNFDLSATADLRGLWDLDHPGAVKLELRAEQASLEKVFAGAAQRLGGSIVYSGRYGAGDFRQWEQWQGNLEAHLALPQLLSLKASGNQKHDFLNLDYELEVSELQKFAAYFPALNAKGKVSSRGSVKGRGTDLVWDGVLTSPLLQVGGVQGEQVSLKGKGRIIGKEGQRELTLKVQNLQVEGRKFGSLNLDLQQEGDGCRFNLKSEGIGAQGGARLTGRLEKLWGPVRTLLVNQSTLTWGKESATVEGRVDASKDGIRVPSLTVQHGSEKVQLAGEVLPDARTDLKLTLDGINLGQWSRVFAREFSISGMLSGQVAVKGRADQPEASLNLQLLRGAVMVSPKGESPGMSSRAGKTPTPEQLIDRLQLQGFLVKDILSIQGDLQSPAAQTPLHFAAKLPMHLSLNPPQLTLKAGEELTSSVKVTALQAEKILPYLDFLDRLGGRLDLDAQVGGTLNQPSVMVNGSWQNGSFRVTRWPNPIENIQVDWQADARQIFIQKSSMNLLGGDVQVKGRIAYPRFFEMDLEADGSNLEAKDIYGIKGTVSGRARLLQTLTTTRLTGMLNLSKGDMNLGQFETDLARNISVVDGAGKAETIEVRKDPTQQSGFVDRLEMDLTINLPPSGTWVHGKGLEAEITGALKLEKRPFAGVKLRGGFQTLRGEYRFQEYKLKIVDGELVFPESPEPDPQLKIVCQKDVKDAIIQVYITGPLKQPKLVMSSIPSMNQVDILSYLLFDRPAGDLSSKESFQLQDKAASWMGTQTSTLLKRVLGDTAFVPDTIEYRKSTSTSRVTSGSGNRTDTNVVAIGKHITPDLYVNFEKGVTGEEGDQVAVEYRINRHLSVQTEFGGTQQSGIDVFLRYDFGK